MNVTPDERGQLMASLVELMQALESTSLEEVNAEIAAVDKEIEDVAEPLRKKRDALIALKRILSVKENGASQRQPRVPRAPKPAKSTSSEPRSSERSPSLSDEISLYLAAAGPSKVQKIADQIEHNYQSVYQCLSNHPEVFRKTAPGEFGLVI